MIENSTILVLYEGKVVGGCVFTPHPDHDFIELHYLGVDDRCQRSVSDFEYLQLSFLGHWIKGDP